MTTRAGGLRRLVLLRSGLFGQQSRFSRKVVSSFKSLVDACEAEVGDVIETPQPVEHRDTDLLAGHLGA